MWLRLQAAPQQAAFRARPVGMDEQLLAAHLEVDARWVGLAQAKTGEAHSEQLVSELETTQEC